MDRYDISVQQLHQVALSCLILASKYGVMCIVDQLFISEMMVAFPGFFNDPCL